MTTASLDDVHAATRGITRLSVAVAVILIVLKTFALGASGSVSILASLADSSLDLIASLATFFAVRWAAAPPDEEHRFGHGKGEAMAALVQAGLVFASAVFIGWEAIQRLFDPRPVSSGWVGVTVIAVSMALTGWLIWRQSRAIKLSGSVAVSADRAHYASDLAANVVVLIGVASGAWLAAPGLDAAAGLVVSVWLFWGAISVLKGAADQLLDRAGSDADRVAITTAVLSDPQITGVHRLRTRQAGPVMTIQMHVDMAPTLTLAQAHDILEAAETRLTALWPHADIMIHPDPRAATPVGRTKKAPETPSPDADS
ncbi:MAG: cation diffusion facilitator family transporter [Brevundimonas sp.]|nr:cation diffusion facilitator family transporter [Brevundimonas sp.]